MLLVTNSDVFSLFFPDTFSGCLYSFILPPILAFFLKIPHALNMVSLFSLFVLLWMFLRKPRSRRRASWFRRSIRSEQLYGPCLRRLQRIESASGCTGDSRYLGHAPTGISAGLAVGVLSYRSQSGKGAGKSVSEVVREGIQDVRASTASVQVPLRDEPQKDAQAWSAEYQHAFQLAGWFTLWMVDVDMDVMIEDNDLSCDPRAPPMRFATVMPALIALYFLRMKKITWSSWQDNGVGLWNLDLMAMGSSRWWSAFPS